MKNIWKRDFLSSTDKAADRFWNNYEGKKTVNLPFGPEYANNLHYKSVNCNFLGLWFHLLAYGLSVRVNGAVQTVVSWAVGWSQRIPAAMHVLTHPQHTISVYVCASVLSPHSCHSQQSLGPHGDPHLRRLKFLLSMTRDLEEEVREEIAQHKEIKYGKRYEAWCGRLE